MKIAYQKYRLTFVAVDDLFLPSFKGSTLRGGFGNAFKKVVCALKKHDCGDCLLKKNCIYSYIFETSVESAKLTQSNIPATEKIPHPFVIEPDISEKRKYEKGEELSFHLILIGRAVEYLPYFIYTFDILGEIGVGKQRGRYLLKEVLSDDKQIYKHTDKNIINTVSHLLEIDEDSLTTMDTGYKEQDLVIKFVTPTRLKSNRDLVVRIDFSTLIKNALRRLCLLSTAHCFNPPPRWDHKTIINNAQSIQIVEDKTRWFDLQRYSNRQKTTMKFGGVVGEIKYKGNLSYFMPIIKAVEVLHIGKGTAFGLGKINTILKN
ncbi:MAG: CRISPR system precrRNA processing endoribonuclease RAMP protein Cas6 [Thermodesulfovibrionales bacterium]|nr:CRISPR system precrRNA processing endoribonuclease RAMP protein Cas6 [Thermodesulfovibrionales bacterium]